MRRRGFLRALLLAPFAKPVVEAIIENLTPVAPVVKPFIEGFKGSAFLEAGIVYAPYIPLYQTCDLVRTDVGERFAKRFVDTSRFKVYYNKETICGS